MKTQSSKFLRIFLFGTILLLCLKVSAQEGDFEPKLPDYVPPSPTAYELGKYGDVPVNESTGIANISIPLYTYGTPNLSVPISMSYATSGIKVHQVASWVGMGWNLNAGGSVTRTVRGMPDEDATVRSFPSYSSVTALKTSDPSAYYDIINKAGTKDHTDYVPDMFNFSVDGISGSFFLDASLDPVIVKKESELKIEKVNAYADGGFIITTPKGVAYTFEAKEYTKQRMACASGNANPTNYQVSTWLLTEIEHPNGDVITLEYLYDSDELLANYDEYFYTASISESFGDNVATAPPAEVSLPSEGRVKCRNFSYVKANILKKIYSNREKDTVFFNASKSRSDLSDYYQLDDITVKDAENNVIKEFEFNYTDVVSTINYYGGADSHFDQSNTTANQKYRLFLDDITEKDSGGSSTHGKVYSFDYEDRTNLPRRLSLAQDELGYYNGESNDSFLPDTEGTSSGSPFEFITKGDRSFNLTYAKKGILTKVTYPTKGYTIIEYESGPSAIRVKKIKSLPKTGATEKIVRYYYTSKENALAGTSGDTEVPFGSDDYIITKPARVSYDVIDPVTLIVSTLYYDFDRTEFKSSGLFPLYSTNAGSFLYSKVTVGYGDNFEGGGVEKLYKASADQFGTAMHGDVIIGGARSNTGYLNGGLIEERQFKKNGTTADLVQTTRYVYKEDATQELTLDNYIGEIVFENIQSSTHGDSEVFGYNVNKIQTKARWRAIDSVITKQYFDTGTVTTIQKSVYGTGLAGLPTEVSSEDSHGNIIKTKNTYTDLGSNNNFAPTTIERLNGTDPLSKVEYEYDTWGTNSLTLPKIIKTLKGVYNASTNPVEERIEFISYYDNGNAKEVEKTDGTRVVYIWGYNETKPIAKIENTTYSALVTALGTTTVADIQDASDNDINGTSENTLRDFLDEIRDALPDAMVSTFTYDPLIGVTSITDPRGKSVYYYYNSYARLEYVKDHDGKILNKTEYNYKN